MIETMAQTGGWLIMATLRFARMPLLNSGRESQDAVLCCARNAAGGGGVLHDGSGYAVVKASIGSRDPAGTANKKVAEAEIRYGVVPFPNESMRATMLETARRIDVPEHLFHAE